MIITRSQALGAHAWFALEGAAFANSSTGGGAGTVSYLAAPASNDPSFVPVGTIEEWSDKPTAKTKKVFTPTPSILVPKRNVTVSQEMAYHFTTNEVTALALQVFYRTSQQLVQASNQFNPLSAPPPHGFLLLQRYSTEGDQADPYMVALIWCHLQVESGIDGGQDKVLMPAFVADQMYSTLNSVSALQTS